MAERMRRTQIYLQRSLSARLDEIARRRGTSRADVIRSAAQRLVDEEHPPDADPLLGLIGMVDTGPGQVSEEHDEALTEEMLGTGRS